MSSKRTTFNHSSPHCFARPELPILDYQRELYWGEISITTHPTKVCLPLIILNTPIKSLLSLVRWSHTPEFLLDTVWKSLCHTRRQKVSFFNHLTISLILSNTGSQNLLEFRQTLWNLSTKDVCEKKIKAFLDHCCKSMSKYVNQSQNILPFQHGWNPITNILLIWLKLYSSKKN